MLRFSGFSIADVRGAAEIRAVAADHSSFCEELPVLGAPAQEDQIKLAGQREIRTRTHRLARAIVSLGRDQRGTTQHGPLLISLNPPGAS